MNHNSAANNNDENDEAFWPASAQRVKISGKPGENQINMKTFEVKVTTTDNEESGQEPDPFSENYSQDGTRREGRKSQDSKGSTTRIIP
jgi:hypothetical protein